MRLSVLRSPQKFGIHSSVFPHQAPLYRRFSTLISRLGNLGATCVRECFVRIALHRETGAPSESLEPITGRSFYRLPEKKSRSGSPNWTGADSVAAILEILMAVTGIDWLETGNHRAIV